MLEKFLENSGYIERKKRDFIRTKICARKRPNFIPRCDFKNHSEVRRTCLVSSCRCCNIYKLVNNRGHFSSTETHLKKKKKKSRLTGMGDREAVGRLEVVDIVVEVERLFRGVLVGVVELDSEPERAVLLHRGTHEQSPWKR